MTLAELKAARLSAGARLETLQKEVLAEGFQDSAEFDAKWDAANKEYDDALEAEDKAIAESKKKAMRADIGARLRADNDRLALSHRNLLRPDFNPVADPRSSAGLAALPTRNEWAVGLRAWASSMLPSFSISEEEAAAVKRCRINLSSSEAILPTGPLVTEMTEEFQEIFISRHPGARQPAIRQALATLNTMTPDGAAYVAVPPTIIQQIEVNKLAWGGLLQVATVKTTTTGEDILLPFSDDTTVKGRRISEDGPLGTEKNPKFGQMKWGSYKYTSDVMAVTFEMLRDAFFSLEEFLGAEGGKRLGRIENEEMTLGNGASMPRGVVFAAPIGVTTASATAITTDEIIDLEMSIDDAYKNGERVGYMMNKGILKYIRKLKDGEGRPFYVLGGENSGRDTLNGKPIFINYDMAAAPVASADVMLYGDFSKYMIRRVGGQRVVRDPYTERISRDRDLFAVVEYADGNLINAGNSPIKKMRMHA